MHIRTSIQFAVALFITTPVAAMGVEPAQANLPLRLRVDLIEGSHVMGAPNIASVSVRTLFAKVDIPLEQIISITIGDDHKTASLELENGDRIKGVVDLAALEINAVFGNISIGIEHIARIHVMSVRRLSPEELARGQVLHYATGTQWTVPDLGMAFVWIEAFGGFIRTRNNNEKHSNSIRPCRLRSQGVA